LAALEHERWVELFTESGDRWFNLKRLNKAKQVLKPIKPLWEGEDRQLLYPIPQQAMQSNPNLEDNPGY
ncbi:MAG TPA: RagB/SusD family nutrient uptake outer membrane protein, partial [Flavisolibacter sp.]|nr:RagB/SusD family nutrient uptake outer membrane protein [Flavisolibacter sp.]